MTRRDRQRHVSEQVYLAKIISAGLNIPEKLFQLWTTLLSLEVFQESYVPEVAKDKENALKLIQDNVTQRHETQVRMFRKLQKLTAREMDMKPATPKELEEFRRRIRQHHLQKAQGK